MCERRSAPRERGYCASSIDSVTSPPILSIGRRTGIAALAFSPRVGMLAAMPQSLILRRPDDWHLHLRDGAMLAAVLPHTARQFARAVVMPNLVPPVTTVAAARAYAARIRAALPAEARFTPLMTCYLTDGIDPAELERGWAERVFAAAKLYPAHATT